MAETGNGRGARWAGRLGRLARFLVAHQVPVAGAAPYRHRPAGRPTVGLVAGHLVSGGYGDQVVDRVEAALDRRGHRTGALDAVDRRAPVVVVTHAGPRTRPVLPAAGVDAPALAGRTVAVVAYGPVPLPDPRPLDALRAALSDVGARVVAGTVLLDTARLHRPAAAARPCGADDRFERLVLELALDDLLADGPRPPGAPTTDPAGPAGSAPLRDPRTGRP